MPTNHAKTIKGMSIACIALAGLSILVCLIALGALVTLGPLMAEALVDSYAYDYGYGYGWDDYDSIFGAYGLIASLEPMHGHFDPAYSSYYLADSYGTLAEAQLALTMLNVAFVIALIGQCVELVAGIIVLKNHNKPEKFGLVFGWSIAGAIVALISGSIVTVVLFIIIAVFINSDKKLYQAGMYFAPAPGAPAVVAGYPVQQPVVPVAPAAPVAPAPPASMSRESTPSGTAVTTAEVYQPADQPVLAPGETQPPAPAATAAPTAAPAPANAAPPDAAPGATPDAAVVETQAEAIVTESPTPVIVDEGAVIRLDIDGEQPSDK